MNDDTIRRNLRHAKAVRELHQGGDGEALAYAREQIAEALTAVREARGGAEQERIRDEWQPTPASGLVATKERKSRGDVKDENFELPNSAVVRRSKTRAPLSLTILEPPAIGDPHKPAMGHLDKALEPHERFALARFIAATVAAEGRIAGGGYGGAVTASDPTQRQHFTQREKDEIGCRQFVFKRLPFAQQRDIELLTSWVLNDGRAPVDPVEWGRRYARTEDNRLANGVVRGAFRRLAETVHDFQHEHDTLLSRRRAEMRAAEERRRLRAGNSLPPEE